MIRFFGQNLAFGPCRPQGKFGRVGGVPSGEGFDGQHTHIALWHVFGDKRLMPGEIPYFHRHIRLPQ